MTTIDFNEEMNRSRNITRQDHYWLHLIVLNSVKVQYVQVKLVIYFHEYLKRLKIKVVLIVDQLFRQFDYLLNEFPKEKVVVNIEFLLFSLILLSIEYIDLDMEIDLID